MSRTPSKTIYKKAPAGAKPGSQFSKTHKEGPYWLYGRHSCEAALANPFRKISKILVTRNAADRLRDTLDKLVEITDVVDDRKISQLLTQDAVHQGIAMLVEPLSDGNINYQTLGNLVILLDEITDPHNIGAILRSASAFGATSVITTFRNSPAETGVLAKSASGAMEWVRYFRVRNLVAAMEELKLEGFNIVGLDGEGDTIIDKAFSGEKIAIVMGAEGKGMRQVTAAQCDVLAKIPMDTRQESLNVSNATAIALWEASKIISK